MRSNQDTQAPGRVEKLGYRQLSQTCLGTLEPKQVKVEFMLSYPSVNLTPSYFSYTRQYSRSTGIFGILSFGTLLQKCLGRALAFIRHYGGSC